VHRTGFSFFPKPLSAGSSSSPRFFISPKEASASASTSTVRGFFPWALRGNAFANSLAFFSCSFTYSSTCLYLLTVDGTAACTGAAFFVP